MSQTFYLRNRKLIPVFQGKHQTKLISLECKNDCQREVDSHFPIQIFNELQAKSKSSITFEMPCPCLSLVYSYYLRAKATCARAIVYN